MKRSEIENYLCGNYDVVPELIKWLPSNQKEFTCKHGNKFILNEVYKLENGTEMYCTQCKDCGRLYVSTSFIENDVPNRKNKPCK